LIDNYWESHIKPVLMARYPKPEEELARPQAYAYGWFLIQDLVTPARQRGRQRVERITCAAAILLRFCGMREGL